MSKSATFLATALLLLVCGSLLCAEAQRCMPPGQFTTGFSQVLSSSDNCVTIRYFGEMYYDSYMQTARLDVQFFYQSNTPSNLSIFLFNQTMTQYVVDLDNGSCQKSAMQAPLGGVQLPANTEFLGTALIGIQSIDLLHVPPQNVGGDMWEAFVNLDSGLCYMQSSVAFKTNSSSSSSGATDPISSSVDSYWNFVPGVPRSAFELPAVCASALVPRIGLRNFKGNLLTRVRPLF